MHARNIDIKNDEDLMDQCSSVFWKAELVNNDIGYLAEQAKCVEGAALTLLTAYSKMPKERDEEKKLFSKRGTELEDLGNSQPI